MEQSQQNNPAGPESSTRRWPSQIKYIVGNEACERFSYYGMRSVLAGYITGEVLKGGLGQTDDYSTEVIHLFVFVNYFMPLLGGWLSDRIIGRYHTILWVSLFYCGGHGVLACSDFVGGVHGKLLCLFFGLALIAFGSGGIKPCVSAFMGDQFGLDQKDLLQKAYGAFYWSINLGSFFSFLVIPWVKNHHGYSPAFAIPGILMAIATFIFWLGRKKYVRIPPSHETKTAGFFPIFFAAFKNQRGMTFYASSYILTALGIPLAAMIAMIIVALAPLSSVMRVIGWVALILIGLWYLLILLQSFLNGIELSDDFWGAARQRFSEREITAARSFGPILFVFGLVPLFWSLFDQTNSTWVLQGKEMLPCALHFPFPTFHAIHDWLHGALARPWESVTYVVGAEEMQSMNPALVMILVPLLTLLIYPRLGRLASPLRRMSYGMFLCATSYLVVAALQARLAAGAQLSVLWQIVPYVILTTAEVLVSTTGLEFAFREAAPEMKSLIMSFWLLSIAFGDLLVAVITKLFAGSGNGSASVSAPRFMTYAGLSFVVAIFFSAATAFYKYRDRAAAEGK